MAASLRLLAVAALVAVVACDAPTYPRETLAFDPTLPFDTGRGVARFASGSTITLYADPTGAPAGYDLRAALATAMAKWSDVPRFGDFTLAQTTDPDRAQVLVRFRATPSIVDFGDCGFGGGLGRTVFCSDTTTADGRGVAPALPYADGSAGSRIKIDVYVDPLGASDVVLQQANQTREEYFVTLLTHELGHVLGIGGHSDDVRDIMNTFPRVREPSRDDEAALRWVWSQPIALRF